MILYPSVDELLERVDSRYSLIMPASKRALNLMLVHIQCCLNMNR